ncbi:uncharacterized protein LOC129590258 [Paramacrobiotus metropolitanus]|uniref:uncharacterized protein LOC129590258 n=1 Tax=Paramacrobiotus metropolitanus TaxID=2943436 RepID=UPI002445600F|nr:uncharacterized protein LOC129590258 [Paramacrobiotus metropolitanus]
MSRSLSLFAIFFLISCTVLCHAQFNRLNRTQVQASIKIKPRPVGSGQMQPKIGNVALQPPAERMTLQREDPWRALDTLRGRQAMSTEDITMFMMTAVPGTDYPAYSNIPGNPFFNCATSVHQPGFYADTTTRCQVFRRCDPDGNLFSYLCPNTTVFNQITLTCDYFFNVDCAKSPDYYDYSNSRLYHEGWLLLGN